MASITIQVPPQLGVGTSLDVHPDPGGDIPPSGPVVSSAIVGADSRVTLTGLTPGVPYQVGTTLGGKWVGMLVVVGPAGRPAGGHAIEDESVFLADRSSINFSGIDVQVTDDAANDQTLAVITLNPNVSRKLTPPTSTSTTSTIALWVDPPSGGKALDGTGGGSIRRLFIRPSVTNGTNGTRGDAINNDSANVGGQSSFAGIEIRNTDAGYRLDDKGSFHQTYTALIVDPYSGGGDVYVEGFNHYASITNNRKGALVGNFEFQTTISAGAPARAAAGRFIVQEFNAISAYDATTFGTGSPWITTGSRGVEILAQGTGASPAGTGLQIHGAAGYNRAICFNTGGIDAFKVGSSGFVDVTRAATTNAAYRTFVNGDANERLQIRADGTILMGDGSAAPTLSISKLAAAATHVFSGAIQVNGTLNPKGNFTHQGANIGFFSVGPAAKQTVTGAKGGNAALASVIAALAAYGLVTDSSTA